MGPLTPLDVLQCGGEEQDLYQECSGLVCRLHDLSVLGLGGLGQDIYTSKFYYIDTLCIYHRGLWSR